MPGKDRRAQTLAENQRLLIKAMMRLIQMYKLGMEKPADLDTLATVLAQRADMLDELIDKGFYAEAGFAPPPHSHSLVLPD